jgi:menaquinone-dependent protoporphyrinogen oxidase
MPKILVVYASTHGHTGKIAGRIAEVLQYDDVDVHVHDVASAAELAPSDYDAVIVGASIHAGHHQLEVIGWAERHAIALGAMPSALFSVCLTQAEDTEESRVATRRYIDDFVDDTGWAPTSTQAFAGALQYLEYDFMTRLLMRLMMRRGNHPTDVTQDYDYTDWDAVERFGHECAAMAGAKGRPAP